MSRSVSVPSSVTKTSPCWNGFIVPGSTLRYGSSFCMLTRSPRSFSRRPRLEAVRPLPRLDATPPVTKRCLVETGRDERGAAWTEERGTSDEGRRCLKSAPEASGKHSEPQGRRAASEGGRGGGRGA